MRGSSFLVSSFFLVSICVWEPNKLFDGNVGWVRKWKLEDGGGNGGCGGKIRLVGGGGGGGGDRKRKDDGGGGGGYGGGKKGSSSGFGGGEVLLFFSFNLFNLFLIVKSNLVVLALSSQGHPLLIFLPPSNSHSKDPTIGFSSSNVAISSKASSSGFCLLKIFFFYWIEFLSKTRIVNPIFCHAILNVSLHPFGKIARC